MDKHIPWDKINEQLRTDRKDILPEVKTWVNESQENQALFDELETVHQLTSNAPESFSPDQERAWSSIEDRIKPIKTVHKFIPMISKIAVAIALMVLGFSISLLIRPKDQHHLTKIHAPKGHKTQVFLPDSSMVYLNGGTSLTYTDNFLHDRQVEVSGEALFTVTKNTESQFTVHTDYIDVDVFGTQFNVKAYTEDPEVEISLLEGSVGLSKNSENISNLLPGQIAVLSKDTRKIRRQKGDVIKIISWASDELIFEDKTFEEITAYLRDGMELKLSWINR